MNQRELVIFGLVANTIMLNILDAASTIFIINNNLGWEGNMVLGTIISNYSIYHAMFIKMLVVIVAAYLILRLRFEDIKIKGTVLMTGTNLIYTATGLLNVIYYGVVLNGILVMARII